MDAPANPAGEFVPEDHYEPQRRAQLIGDIERAPSALRRAVSGLSDAQLDALYKQYPDIKDIYKVYPNKTRRQALTDRYETLKNRRQIGGAKAEAGDESQARKTLAALTAVENLEARVEPFRALRLHWKAGERTVRWWNSMATSFLVHNFLLWAIPDFEAHLPIVADHQRLTALLRSDRRPYPPAEGGVHAADFAEYAYLYQRAWTSSQTIRQLLAHIPTFRCSTITKRRMTGTSASSGCGCCTTGRTTSACGPRR